MQGARVFNPDDYLRTPQGRVFTAERNAAAWECLYANLEELFATATTDIQLYVVMGVQGSGKSTWIRCHEQELGPCVAVVDAALPARRHRTRLLALAKHFNRKAIAVWLDVPLNLALVQNATRPLDERVPEDALRSVFDLLEPPTLEEGFDDVLVPSREWFKPPDARA